MGQAKRRGTFEQRLSAALAVEKLERDVVLKLSAKHNMPAFKVKKRLGFAMLATLVIGSIQGKRLSSLQHELQQP